MSKLGHATVNSFSPARRGFPAVPGSALRLLDRLTADYRKRALIPTLHESQKAIEVIQRLPS